MIKAVLSKFPLSEKFAEDTSWMIASFAIMGLIGILLNILIAKFYDATALGVFNQVYSIYILFSQLAVFGIHLSILRYVPEFEENDSSVDLILFSALVIVTVNASVITIFYYSLKNLFAYVLDSPSVGKAIGYALPGLIFFAMNKVLLAHHNARRNMKAYAVFQSLRYVFLLVALVVLIFFEFGAVTVSSIFPAAEILLFLVLLAFSAREIKFNFSQDVVLWSRKHFMFGSKAVVGNTLIDVNTRIDVLMLGIFVSDRIVGVYSFAAMLADGFYQLPVVLRTNFTPLIAGYKVGRDTEGLEKDLNQVKILFYKFLVPIGIGSIFCFPLIIMIFNFTAEFAAGWAIFAILIGGILLAAGYLPFQLLFNQLGHPGHQTLFLSLIFITNVCLNAALIPIFGIYGAAMATATACASQVFYLKSLAYKTAGISL